MKVPLVIKYEIKTFGEITTTTKTTDHLVAVVEVIENNFLYFKITSAKVTFIFASFVVTYTRKR